MSLSLFVLALWVFLQSYVQLGWGTVDAKLLGWVGILFVVVVVVEAVLNRGALLGRFRRND